MAARKTLDQKGDGKTLSLPTVTKTPRFLCSLILSPPPPPPPNTPTLSGNPSYSISNIIPSKNELSFMRLKPSKGRQFGSHDSISMRSLSSRQSTNTSFASNVTSSLDANTAGALRRSGSFSSVTSGNSITGQASVGQSLDKSTSSPTAAFAHPVNSVMSATTMKIAFGEYLLVPTSDARIFVYQIADFLRAEEHMQELELDPFSHLEKNESIYKNIGYIRKLASNIQLEKETIQPILCLGPFYIGDYNTAPTSVPLRSAGSTLKPVPASIVDLCQCEYDLTAQNSKQGSIAILTQDGGVHVFEFSFLHSTARGEEDDFSQLKVELLHKIHAGDICATAISMQRSLKRTSVNVNNTVLRQFKAQLNISIGFENGDVAEFAVADRQHVLKWKLSMGSPVTALAYAYARQDISDVSKESPDRRSPTRRDSSIPLEHQLHLAIGTSQDEIAYKNRHVVYTSEDIISSCLDVINVEFTETEWLAKCKSVSDETNMISSNSIDINEVTIWPDNYVLGHDPRQIFLPGKRVKDKLVSGAIDAVCRIETSGKDANCFSVILGNGSVATFHFKMDPSRGFCWGIVHENNHVMLPNANCCGLGLVHTADIANKEMIVACCLRAGTTLLIPTTSGKSISNHDFKNVTIHSLSFDATGVDDDSIRYVQGFAAGNIYVRSWGRTSLLGDREKMPIFFQAWANGYIDCFVCQVEDMRCPKHQKRDEREQYLFQRLLSNGAIGTFCNLLSLNHSDRPMTSLLKQASEEYKLLSCSEEDLISKIMQEQNDVQSIRILLFKMVSGCDIKEM